MNPRTKDIICALPLFVVAFFFMLPLADGGFLTDDYHNIRFATWGPEGKTAFDPDDPTEVLNYFHTKATDRFELYRPLVPLSFRVSYELSGTEPRPYILTNIVLHILGALTGLLLLRSLFPDAGTTALLVATALFLFSPLQTQVAYWSSARSDSLCWIFGSLALLVKWSNRRRMILPLFLAALSMLSKEAGLVFLALVGFCDLLPEEESKTGGFARLPRIAALVFLAVAYVGVRSWVFGGLAVDNAYGSEDFMRTLKEDGLDNLKSGLMTALAPVTAVIIPHDALRTTLKVVLGAGSAWILLGGLLQLGRKGLPRFLVVTALLVGPFVMAGLVSRLDERFINTRGCYIPVFALCGLLALLLDRRGRLPLTAAIVLVAANLPVSWQLQERYVEAASGTEKVLEAMREPLSELDEKRYTDLVVLNFQHMTWFQGGFSAAGCLQPAMMRPFFDADLSSRLVLLDKKDERAFLTPVAEAFSNTDTSCVLEMRYREEDNSYFFTLLHPRRHNGPAPGVLEALSPGRNDEVELDADSPDTLVPRFKVRHAGAPAAAYRVCLFNAKGRVVDTIAVIEKTSTTGDGTEISLHLDPMSPAMAREQQKPTIFLWSVYAETADGEIKFQSPLTPYLVRLKQS